MIAWATYDVGALRIGEFARRVGVTPELLRAWERRYGLLEPIRTEGGFRLYTDEDAERVERMKLALDEGLSAAEAARRALAEVRPTEGLLENARQRLVTAAHEYDEAAVHAVLDEALAGFALETVLGELILPALRDIGDEWERGELEIGQEHFASQVVRGRLLGLARLWGRGGGPLAILACAPGETHDIGLIAFGLMLRSHGWRVLFLGADTPLPPCGALSRRRIRDSSSSPAWTARCSRHRPTSFVGLRVRRRWSLPAQAHPRSCAPVCGSTGSTATW